MLLVSRFLSLTLNAHTLPHTSSLQLIVRRHLPMHSEINSHVSVSDRTAALREIAAAIDGELLTADSDRRLYATDASPYEHLPLAVVRPRHHDDCLLLVRIASRYGLPLIPRGAGTSLAGQCVGAGLVVDTARHLREIVNIDPSARWVRVQPGVVLDDLNAFLQPLGLIFPVDPSTASRCTLGGMFGNNAWGVHAPRYGTTRDYVLAARCVLSDGSEVEFAALDEIGLRQKLELDSLEGAIYRHITETVSQHCVEIERRYPSFRGIPNNAGYALDVLLKQAPFQTGGPSFNLAPFLCGSEGTLALVTELQLRLETLPGKSLVICAHFESLAEALKAVPFILAEKPAAVELLDRKILELTAAHPQHRRNRFWLEGDPAGVLLIELSAEAKSDLQTRSRRLVEGLTEAHLGYAFTVVSGPDLTHVWDLRRAGLGLLMGLPGNKRAESGVEDSAVAVARLPYYYRDVAELFAQLRLDFVCYGSVSRGLLHLRPLMDLNRAGDRVKYTQVLEGVAGLVATYGGSFSAKHGDGRLRANFLAYTLGKPLVEVLKGVKQLFDFNHIFNPGVILDSPPPSADLRRVPSAETAAPMGLHWHAPGGWQHEVQKCHGAGTCLKTGAGGVMCPSFRATQEEALSTRGRANLLRHALAANDPERALADAGLARALDLCLGCKGCKSECPATVDMARLKSEYLHRRYRHEGVPARVQRLARFVEWSETASRFPRLANAVLATAWPRRYLGIHPARRLPRVAVQRLSRLVALQSKIDAPDAHGDIVLVIDPITEYYEPAIGLKAAAVLRALAYRVELTPPVNSSRLQISLGLLDQAREVARVSLAKLSPLLERGATLIGLEPSETMSFRDEFPDLFLEVAQRRKARTLASRIVSFEEFLAREQGNGYLDDKVFKPAEQSVAVHVHCHQQALSNPQTVLDTLQLIPGCHLQLIPSGCCGMAGNFGYERDHYELSMQIGEQVLFPALRSLDSETRVVATGTSCRQQVWQGTGLAALHTAEILYEHLAIPSQ